MLIAFLFASTLIALMVWGIIETYKSRIVIYADRIVSVTAFSKKELKFTDIQGYKVEDQYIFIEPRKNTIDRIKISSYTGGYKELLSLISQSFPDIAQQNKKDEQEVILSDESLGFTREKRERKLVKARQTAMALNFTAGTTAAWIFFYPTPYHYAMLAAIVMPIITLVTLKISDGLIRLEQRKDNPYPTVVYALLFPSLAILTRSLVDFHILNYANVWLLTILMALALLFLFLIKQKEITFKNNIDYTTVLTLTVFLSAYSFGTLVFVNCYYDNSIPKNFTAEILEKKINTGKHTSYNLKLSKWGSQKKNENVSIGADFYNRVEIGEEVNIALQKGTLKFLGSPLRTYEGLKPVPRIAKTYESLFKKKLSTSAWPVSLLCF